MSKRVAIYVKGGRSTPEYYRIYQYFDHIEGILPIYHCMLGERMYRRFMPVSRRSLIVKVLVYATIYLRMLAAMVSDCLRRPDIIVVHKRIISHFMPPSFSLMLRHMVRRGTKLLWDYDDHILATHEIAPATFNLMARLATTIAVTHDYLAHLVPTTWRDKVHILPTTDGDLYPHATAETRTERLRALKEEVRLVWIGTAFNLPYVEGALPALEKAAEAVEATGRKLTLTIVCDKPLKALSQRLTLQNIPWSHQAAIDHLRTAHIGIMPLTDTPFNRGKGGFKLVQYLSMALPCIASNVGYNSHVLSPACGILLPPEPAHGWAEAIVSLAQPQAWQQASREALKQWQTQFSYQRNLRFWQRACE